MTRAAQKLSPIGIENGLTQRIDKTSADLGGCLAKRGRTLACTNATRVCPVRRHTDHADDALFERVDATNRRVEQGGTRRPQLGAI